MGWREVIENGKSLGQVYNEQPIKEEDDIRLMRRLLRTMKEITPKSNGKTVNEPFNKVILAGELKADPQVDENNVRALVAIHEKGPSVAVSVYMHQGDIADGEDANEKGRSLGNKLKRYRKGDYIQLYAKLRPWSKKSDSGEWKNGLAVDIVDIRNEPPERPDPRSASAHDPSEDDDRIPF